MFNYFVVTGPASISWTSERLLFDVKICVWLCCVKKGESENKSDFGTALDLKDKLYFFLNTQNCSETWSTEAVSTGVYICSQVTNLKVFLIQYLA